MNRVPCLLVLLLALTGCARNAMPDVTGGAKPPKIFVQMDWYAQSDHGGYYQALQKGFYREAGLDVTILESGPGIAGGQRIAVGTVQFGIGQSDELIVEVGRDVPVVAVCAQMQHVPMALLLHRESPVNSFADLQGKPVMTVPGANWIIYLQRRYHIEFPISPLNFGMAQFMADPNFIQQCFITNEPYYVEKNGGHAKTLLLSDSGFDPYRVLIGNADFVAQHPKITRAFVQASIRGWIDYMNGDPTPANLEIMKRNIQMTPDFLAFGYAAIKQYHLVEGNPAKGEDIGRLSRQRLQEQIDALQLIGVLDRPVTVDEIAAFQFTQTP